MVSTTNYYSVSGVSFSDNERSYVIQVISEINAYLSDKSISIKRAGGERTINGGSFVKFPDVLLFSDSSQSIILQGWEAKCPDVSIDDPAFVEDARNKARLLRCNSCILWNFQYAQLHVCNDAGEFSIAESWTIDPRIRDRSSISLYEHEWKEFLHRLIDKINEYVVTGEIKHRSLGDALTGSVMPSLINENKSHLALHLKKEAARDVRIDAAINTWWEAVKNEYSHDENDPYLAYSKNILVNWLNKFMFANLIQTQFDAARVVADITEGCKIQEALDYFDFITSKCDYYNVFSHFDYAELMPEEAWEDLVSFNQLLLECDISRLESDYSHKILENSISVTKRQIAGQYPTPEPLSDLMSEIAVRNAYGNVWDCCCGTGTIGCSVWNRKVKMLKDIEIKPQDIAYETTWMSDIHDFPLQVATQSFSSLSPSKKPLLVFCKNVFDVHVADELNVIDPASGDMYNVEVPRFDAIVSNLPFVDFNTSEISWYDRVKEETNRRFRDEFGFSILDRSDLYCYIALYLDSLLSDSGYACLLTSNSWLCTEAGESFMNGLRSTFDIEGIYVNGKYRWFANADVMNVLLVLTKKGNGRCDGAYFGVIGASINDLAKDDIRSSISRSVISHENQCESLFREEFHTWDDLQNLKDLGLSYYAICQGASIVAEMASSLVRAKELFEIARGTKSGQDDFFFSNDPGFVDPEFRLDLLKNLRDVDSFTLKPNGYAFFCDKSESYLAENGFKKTLDYIRSVDKINDSCRGHRPYWYTLPESAPLSFTTSMNTGGRLFFAGVPKGTRFVANQRVLCFKSKTKDLDEELCLALLNSTLGMLLIEASAAPMALGALDTRAATFKQMYVLNPELVTETNRTAILSAFEPLKQRKVNDALIELEMEDRKSFDRVVLRCFGLEKYHDAIRQTLKRMLETRLYRHV
jgi:hypothetical protein